MNSTEWIEFLRNVKKAKLELGNPEILWYRGQWNEKNYLLPSLLRYKNGLDKERFLYTNFRRFSDKIFKRRQSEWETLFDMQHYGIPTRLLDWTESFGISLFFAAYYNNHHSSVENAAIYLISPEKLNKESGLNKIYKLPDEESEFQYKNIYWKSKSLKPKAPIAIEPIFINDRMFAQRGVFTVHNDLIDPIENLYPDSIKKVILPNNIINVALDFLELANINHYSVFPDLFGIAGHLTMTSGLESRYK